MENVETPSTVHNYDNSKDYTGEVSSFEGEDNFTLQGQLGLNTVVSESTYESIEPHSDQEDGLSAVDLRMIRPPSVVNPPVGNMKYYENKKTTTAMAHLFKNVSSNDFCLVNLSFDTQVENPTENANYSISHLKSHKDDLNPITHNYCTLYQKIGPQKNYTLKRINFNSAHCAKNNVDFVLLVDQETQTPKKEFKEASVQTVKDGSKCTYSLLKKKNLSSFNYSCMICQRFYTSKSSYERHAQTHVKNGNVITNLQITKKSKFMIFEDNVCNNQSHLGLPKTLQGPKLAKFQCGVCCKLFSSQVARDFHRDNFVIEEFPMTKCKECDVKFFTLGALHEHVSFVHTRNTCNSNAYCCIFCNDSFESSYNFQLHLDEHLTTQINI